MCLLSHTKTTINFLFSSILAFYEQASSCTYRPSVTEGLILVSSTWMTLIALQTGWKARSPVPPVVLQMVTHMLFAGDLCLMSSAPNHMQTMLNKLRAYAWRKSLTVNTQKSEVMCLLTYTSNLPPLFYDGVQLPYTDSFKYLGMVCDRLSTWILQLMQRYVHSQLVLSASNSSYAIPSGNMTI